MSLFGAGDDAQTAQLLEKRLSLLQGQLDALQKAFDAWFDVVAGELGYEAAKGWSNSSMNFLYMPGSSYLDTKEHAVSPRRHAEVVTPAISTPVRTKPKICAKRGRRKSK